VTPSCLVVTRWGRGRRQTIRISVTVAQRIQPTTATSL
jgi:hypothetical protein